MMESEQMNVQSLFPLVYEHAPVGIALLSLDGKWLNVNNALCNYLGYTEDEMIDRYFYEFFYEEDRRECLPDLMEIMSEKRTIKDRDQRFAGKNGKLLYLSCNASIVLDDSGEPMYVLAHFVDVTERVQNVNILKEAERIASIGSWEWDEEHDIVTLSDQVYSICRLDPEQINLSNLDIFDLVPKEHRTAIKKTVRRALRGKPLVYEYSVVHPDQTVQYLCLQGIVTKNKNGEIKKITGTIQDITERKVVERKLQETVERYTSLKKYNHDAVISFDLQGHIIHGNNMAEKLTGYTIQELEGMSLAALIGQQNLRKILAKSLADDSIENDLNTIRNKKGELVDVLPTIAPIIINSENVGFYLIAKDITEQKKLLLAKETAENTNKAKSAFLAMMSHEIRTPMNGVIGMTDLLMETTELDEEQKEYIQIIRKSGESLLNIINDILDFSKIESGKTSLTIEPFKIRDTVNETVELLRVKADQKKLNMVCRIDESIPETLIGDGERLKQVLVNLIGNAVKFTLEGEIAVDVSMVKRYGNKAELEFAVKDTGIGIPKEKVNELFQPFSQLDNFLTRKHEGTGLGLAISQKLVELMGGRIWLDQSISEQTGAVFKFTCPFTMEQAQYNGEQYFEGGGFKAQTKKLDILVGEDNETNQIVIRKMLEKMGHEVTIACNGKEAMEMAKKRKYDMIFMDIQMPEMNGLEATQQIKRLLPKEEVPVIVAVTAHALKGDRELYMSSGMDDYITKPLKSSVLAEVINQFFNMRNRAV